jgi:hypothetical protein
VIASVSAANCLEERLAGANVRAASRQRHRKPSFVAFDVARFVCQVVCDTPESRRIAGRG